MYTFLAQEGFTLEQIWKSIFGIFFSQALFVDHCHEVKVNLKNFCHDDFGV